METGDSYSRPGRSGLGLRTLCAFALFVALVFAALPTGASALDTLSSLYLTSSGNPIGGLSSTNPSGSLGNYDSGRNSDPGLTIAKGGQGTRETNPAKYQKWIAGSGSMELDGPVLLTFWSAVKDFESAKRGMLRAYLLECSPSGDSCDTITTSNVSTKPWNPAGDWVATTVDFGTVTRSIAADRRIAIEIVVSDSSGDDMWFAYDASSYPSRLTVTLSTAPATTTTTTTTTTPPTTTTTTTAPPNTTTTTTPPAPGTTTTTTAAPVTTTTTFSPPGTTTTGPPNTTTTAPPTVTDSTTTSTVSPTTTTTPPGTTTTTPTAGKGGVPVVDSGATTPPPTNDPAMGALPEPTGEAPPNTGLTSGLFDSLSVVIPPLAATVVLSPLLILEALVAAFVTTGRDLIVPVIFLLVVSAWITRNTIRTRAKIMGSGSA